MPLCAAVMFVALTASSSHARAEEPAPGDAAPTSPAATDRTGDVEKLGIALASDDAAIRLDAATKAKDVQDAKLLKALATALKDEVHEVRVAVMEALGTRTGDDARKSAAAALHKVLGPLSKKPVQQPELLIALRAVHDLAHPTSIKPLLEGIDVHTDREVVDARLLAVANIAAPEAIDELIQFLSKGRKGGDEGQRGAAHRALTYATGERLKNDPDVWRAWWKDARKTFDFAAAAEARAAVREKQDRRNERREGRGENGDREPRPGDGGGAGDARGDGSNGD
jgi:hypothetical protein